MLFKFVMYDSTKNRIFNLMNNCETWSVSMTHPRQILIYYVPSFSESRLNNTITVHNSAPLSQSGMHFFLCIF